MSARHKPPGEVTLPPVTRTRFLVVAEKSAPPFGGSAKPFGTKPQGGADAMPAIPEQDDVVEDDTLEADEAGHSWAGDLIDESVTTPSDPAGAFAQYAGEDGEMAWLDQDPNDLTLTGWVRDVDGSVYRYSDADAWAIDVDDAGMVESTGAPAEGEEEVLDEEAMAQEDGSAVAGQEDFLEGKQMVLRAVVRPKV